MIWKNAELYNVSELIPCEENDGFCMARVPLATAAHLNPNAQHMNLVSTGCEIRFRIRSGSVKIRISVGTSESAESATNLILYYGAVLAGWQTCYQTVYATPTELVIEKHQEPEKLALLHSQGDLLYAPELVRLILPAKRFVLYDIEGDIEPPRPTDAPALRVLNYGSSITHGSLSLIAPNAWTNVVAERCGADLINLGYAGSAFLEPQMAQYIAARDDYAFSILELGINLLGSIDPESFRARVHTFVETVATAHPDRTVFCLDIFYCCSDMLQDGKADALRRVLTEELDAMRLPNVVHIRGMELLDRASGLSADFVHPNVRGVAQIADRLAARILAHRARA